MFRLRGRSTRRWLLRFQENSTYPIWTDNKAEALILPDEKREFWEEDEDYEIVPLAVDEIMVVLGAPRLPGFEEVDSEH